MTETLPDQLQKSQPPLVTVAMPIYNAGKYLRLAVLSIARQTFADWELLIIDDGSTDDALQYIADINDERIIILRDGANRGLAARVNEAVEMARGQYLARMDQDDVSYPERLARQIAILQNDPDLDLVATRAIVIDESNVARGLLPYSPSHNEICVRPWRGFYLPHPTWMGRTEWFRKHRYTVPGPYFCEDQELLLRSHRESRFASVDEVLLGYRVRGKTNWQKLAKIRWTLFVAQVRYFSSLNMWFFALLATVSFFAKMNSDLVKRMMGIPFQSEWEGIDDAKVFEWHKILDSFAMEPKAP